MLWFEGWEGRDTGHRIFKDGKHEEVSRYKVEEASRIKIMEGLTWQWVWTLCCGEWTEHDLMILSVGLSRFILAVTKWIRGRQVREAGI